MKLTVNFTPLGIKPQDIHGRPVLVIDILRCTTTIVQALANGARSVIPVATAEEALRMAQNLERDAVRLCGERRLEPIPGFDLGNSPLEMTEDAVDGRTLLMTTTNGTAAIVAAEQGSPVVIGAATNFSAVVDAARAALDEHGEITIICSGRERSFALEDAYAAGRFCQALIPGQQRRAVELNDAAIAALELVRRYGDKWKRAIAASAAAHALKAAGYRQDVAAATEVDVHAIVPRYHDRIVTLAPPA
jgi:2-phosphosulfolactate phosphatase